VDLESKLKSKQAVVGVIGLGYVGLPLVRAFCGAGFRVIGFDTDPNKVRTLRAGGCYIKHFPPEPEQAATWIESKAFTPTDDFARLGEADAILICVPTPLKDNRDPDLSSVQSTAEAIARTLRPGQLIVLESTTYPGTTEEVVLPILERTDRRVGTDFYLAYSPEREDPGNPDFSVQNIPKVVGGVEATSRRLAATLYGMVVDRVVEVSSTRAAEATKMLENIYRGVNIALVNELKMVFEKMDIDVWEVIRASATKPFGFQPFYPGPGFGGHCIPIDPFYLVWKARQYGQPCRFIQLAGEINQAMPDYVLMRLAEALEARGKQLAGAKVLLLGAAYKKDTDDIRESPTLRLIDLLRARGATVSYNDPHIAHIGTGRRYDLRMDSQPLTAELLAAQDAVLIATAHSAYDYAWIVEQAPLVVDTRNATADVAEHRDRIVRA